MCTEPDVLDSGGSRPSDKRGGGGRGGGHQDHEIRGGGLSQKNVFSALWASVWSKNKVGGPSSGFATVGTYKLAPRGRAREKFWRRSRLRASKSYFLSPLFLPVMPPRAAIRLI